MADIVIFRVEDDNGVGFGTKLSGVHNDFHGELTVWADVVGESCTYDFDANIHPHPGMDSLLCDLLDVSEYSFGFYSARQMREWLYKDKWLVALHKHGMKVVTLVIDSEYVVIGEKQCLFLKDKVTYSSNEDILSYFGL